jgi:SAM-dependent methyltransferase
MSTTNKITNVLCFIGLALAVLAVISAFATQLYWIWASDAWWMWRSVNMTVYLFFGSALVVVCAGVVKLTEANAKFVIATLSLLLVSQAIKLMDLSGFTPSAARATAGKYVFTTDWVTPHEQTWRETLKLFKGRPNVRALEIGSYEGRSAIWFLENILTDPSSSIITIDLFNGPFEQVFDRNVSGFKNQVTKIKAPSHDALRPLKPGSFDFVYIDGSHVAKDVFLDAALSWDLLKPGGVLIFDDYELKGPAGEPKPALDAFLNVFDPYIKVKHKGSQLIVKKR